MSRAESLPDRLRSSYLLGVEVQDLLEHGVAVAFGALCLRLSRGCRALEVGVQGKGERRTRWGSDDARSVVGQSILVDGGRWMI